LGRNPEGSHSGDKTGVLAECDGFTRGHQEEQRQARRKGHDPDSWKARLNTTHSQRTIHTGSFLHEGG